MNKFFTYLIIWVFFVNNVRFGVFYEKVTIGFIYEFFIDWLINFLNIVFVNWRDEYFIYVIFWVVFLMRRFFIIVRLKMIIFFVIN
jgi:hypothetical protein